MFLSFRFLKCHQVLWLLVHIPPDATIYPSGALDFACFCFLSFVSITVCFSERFRTGYNNVHVSEHNVDKELDVCIFHSYITFALHLHTVFMLKLLGWGAAAHQT
jgi:hypothetical protein